MTQYFFVLGNNPTLSIAELVSIFPDNKSELINKEIFLIKLEENFNAQELIKRLGGTIKLGEIHGDERLFVSTTNNNIKNQIIKLIDLKNIKCKFNFGVSFYGARKFNIKPLAMEIKKYLKELGISSRWVTSRDATLSSVVVVQNKLTSDGIEIVLIESGDKIIIGKTLAVQPFKELSFRDYGRPGRDDLSGMLPPKLAQIMINFALPHPVSSPLQTCPPAGEAGREAGGEVILDPFCGSGTILTEAMLMGFKNLIGADISKKAVQDTKANINWIKSNFQLSTFNFQLFNLDVLRISKHIRSASVDAIITEPYLGPQRGKFNLEKTIKELEKLYSQSLAEFQKVLKPNGKVVMVWPVFRGLSFRGVPTEASGRRSNLTNANILEKTINPTLANFKIVSPIPEHLKKNLTIKLTDRNTIIYGRPNQKVWREIVVMEKI